MLNKASTDAISLEKEKCDVGQAVDEVASHKIRLKDRAVQALRIVFFCALLLISSAPSCFIVLDRWFGKPINIGVINKIWWDTEILKFLPYPPYFLLIFPTTLLAALFVFFWRTRSTLVFSSLDLGNIESLKEQASKKRTCAGLLLLICAFVMIGISVAWMLLTGRIPGWELLVALALFIAGQILLDFPADSFRSYFQAQKWFLLDAALFVLALCGALYALFGETKPNLILYLLFVLAGINFLRHCKVIPLIFWVSIAALVALTWRINDWHYVVIGDEYSFFTEVLNILDNRTAGELINTTFNGNFVYGTHPYFSSYIQDFFMKMFDNHNFGWRFSNPVLVACSLPFFYYFLKAFIPRNIAVITVVFLGFSHYLLSFSKIGYNNLQALFAMGLVLAAFVWALKSMKPIAFSATGLAMGFCFYIYPAALYVVPLPILGFLIFLPPTNKAALKRWVWMILSAGLLTYPLIVQPRYWQAKIPGTFLYTNAGDSLGMFVQNVLHNTLYSALSYLYSITQSHYVSGGYLDPLSSIFVIMGFVLLVKAVFPLNKPALFLVLSFLGMFVLVGATHGRDFPTTTRMFLLLPWLVLFATFGLTWSAETAESLFHVQPRMVIIPLVCLVVAFNVYHTYSIDIENMAQYHSLAPMFVKTVREINANSQTPPKSYAFVAPPGWTTDGMEIIQRAYLIPASPRQLINLPVEGDQLPASALDLVNQRDIVVIVKGDMDGNLLARVDDQLRGWGKSMCEVRNGKGALQFQLWHSGDLSWLCP